MLRSESLSTKKDTGRQVLRIQAAAGFLSGDSETGAMRLMNCNVLDQTNNKVTAASRPLRPATANRRAGGMYVSDST